MSETTYRGIDYSGPHGTCNRDSDSGIRYGIIPAGDCHEYIYDAFEPEYGDPHCPKCGNEAKDIAELPEDAGEDWERAKHECEDWYCPGCQYIFGAESAYPDEAIGHIGTDAEYTYWMNSDDNDIWISKSPYFTYAQFCSPCAPGACYLTSPLSEPTEGNRAYCFGPDWFQSDDSCRSLPYPVYSVETGELIAWPSDWFDGLLFGEPDCTMDEFPEGFDSYHAGRMATESLWHAIPWRTGFYVARQ